MTRPEQARAFIVAQGWADAARSHVAGDASNRRYDRLTRSDGTSAILMDAPPDKGEDVRPFVQIALYLSQIGLSAPKIYAQDAASGYLLIEDLGDDLFARLLASGADEQMLYAAAVDVLCHLHAQTPPELDRYDAAAMTPLSLLAFDWYQQAATGAVTRRSQAEAALRTVLEPLPCSVLIQRDYHAENLLWMPARGGVARVGLLDFQDAILGHPAYDLCSVLMDARRDVAPDVQQTMLARYCDRAAIEDTDAFEAAYWALALQRNLRILGVFTRLCVRDGKESYVDMIQRVWGHIEAAVQTPALAPQREAFIAALPVPSGDILDRIRTQCATHPTQR
ncbi:MAG: phosphotransferase [Pseudomonadota bacterium]